VINIPRTRCGLIAEAIGDEDKAIEFYERLREIVGRDNQYVIDAIKAEQEEHKDKLMNLYERLYCMAKTKKGD